MYKASFVGIDNSGKTSVVQSFEGMRDVSTIHATAYRDGLCLSRASRIITDLARFGERNQSKTIAGFAYFLHLVPYFLEERSKATCKLLISDRDPIVDTICYSAFYLPSGVYSLAKPVLQASLESVFAYPQTFVHLEVSPEISLSRFKKQRQLHESLETLTGLRHLLEKELFEVEQKGIEVMRINTDGRSLEEVKDIAKFTLKGKM